MHLNLDIHDCLTLAAIAFCDVLFGLLIWTISQFFSELHTLLGLNQFCFFVFFLFFLMIAVRAK